MEGYTLPKENYSDDAYSQFEKELEEAATVLGDPSASQDAIDNAKKELDDAKEELVNTYYALKYDNLFSAYEYSQHLGSMTMNVSSNASIDYNAGSLTVVSNNPGTTDVYAKEGATSDYYNIKVKPSTEYVFEYDVTTSAGSQVVIFFYDVNGNQIGSTSQTADGHVVLRFTTDENVDRVGFRFGNTNNIINTSTFSNIRLIEAENYYADAEYSKTESVYKEYDTYGTLITPVRPGYTFAGWVYEDGTPATQADLATAHKSIYSTWNIVDYTITYNVNGGTGSPANQVYNVEGSATLPTPTRDDYTFGGWKVTATDGNWTVGTVYQPDELPEGLYGNVSLTAVWNEIPPYAFDDSVVIDYGLPVKIHVCANDRKLEGGVLTAIGTKLASGVQLGEGAYSTSQLLDKTTSGLALPNGTASIDGDAVVYTPTNTSMSVENTFYYEYKSADNMYYYATVKVIPAANIYYEESFMNFIDGEGYVWAEPDDANPLTGKFQAEDRPGEFEFPEYDANNAYGKDSAYDDSYTYSLGNAKYTSVDKDSSGKEPTAEFTFCGTGFDLFSVTNNNTGAVLVTVCKTDGTIQDNFIVDTYYGYAEDENGLFVPNANGSESLYQVPIISARELDYDTYKVVIKPIYVGWFDMFGDGSYDIYVDSVRIFNPAGVGDDLTSDVIVDAYYEDGEFAPMYQELRDTILSATEYYSEQIQSLGNYITGSLFLDGKSSGVDELGIQTYAKEGPNNEVLLGENQAVAFKLTTEDASVLTNLQLAMRVVTGNNAQVVIMNSDDKSPNAINLSGSHEQFQNINPDVLVWEEVEVTENGVTKTVYQTVHPIVIVNTSDTVVSLTTFKWAHTVAPESAEASVTFTVDRSTGEQASYALRRVMDSENDSTDNDIVTPDEPSTGALNGILAKIINFFKRILDIFGGVFG